MKLTTLLFFSILSFLTSCNGQNSNLKNHSVLLNEINVQGDTVKELGSSIMMVFQDKKNNYWFGSWETGVYRYDGKTLINYTTKHGLHNNRVDDIKEEMEVEVKTRYSAKSAKAKIIQNDDEIKVVLCVYGAGYYFGIHNGVCSKGQQVNLQRKKSRLGSFI